MKKVEMFYSDSAVGMKDMLNLWLSEHHRVTILEFIQFPRKISTSNYEHIVTTIFYEEPIKVMSENVL